MTRPAMTILVCSLLSCSCAEVVRDAWPDGSPRRTGQVVAGRQEGTWTYHHPGGALAAQGRFDHDLQTGAWTYHHPDGAVAARGAYVDGLRSGVWSWLRPDGSLDVRGAYRADRQDGPWVHVDEHGTVRAVGWFARGTWEGPWTTCRADGTVSEAGAMLGGVPVGPWTSLGDDGMPVVTEHPAPRGWLVTDDRRQAGVRLWTCSAPGGAPEVRVALQADAVPLLVQVGAAALSWDGPGKPRLTLDPPAADTVWVGYALDEIECAVIPPLAAMPEPVVPLGPMAVRVPPEVQAPALPPVADTEPMQPPEAESLSPVPVLPGLWLASQEGTAAPPVADSATSGGGTSIIDRRRLAWHGQPPPRTRLLASDGQVLDLAAYAGKRVVVVVMRGFAGQVCRQCAAQAAALSDAVTRLRDGGTEVVVVYPGPAAAVATFREAVRSLGGHPDVLPVCLDAGLVLVRALGLEGNLALPATLILDRQGIVRWSWVGTDIADRPSVTVVERALSETVR